MPAILSDRASAPARRAGPARAIWFKMHRWLGLTLAAFLVMAGLTGTLLAFNDSIDASLNSRLFRVQPRGQKLSPLEVREHAS